MFGLCGSYIPQEWFKPAQENTFGLFELKSLLIMISTNHINNHLSQHPKAQSEWGELSRSCVPRRANKNF